MSFYINPGSAEIELRSPDFANAYRLQRNQIARFTLAGGLYKIFADSNWITLTVHAYQFSVISTTTVTAILAYFKANIGVSIDVQDHHGTTISGFVFNPVTEVVGVRPPCTNSLGFEILVAS